MRSQSGLPELQAEEGVYKTAAARAYKRDPRVHQVKSWLPFFRAIKAGLKTHDLRVDDRGYEVGDQLMLHEWDQERGQPTGERLCVWITFITNRARPCAFSCAVLSPEYCILSIQKEKPYALETA